MLKSINNSINNNNTNQSINKSITMKNTNNTQAGRFYGNSELQYTSEAFDQAIENINDPIQISQTLDQVIEENLGEDCIEDTGLRTFLYKLAGIQQEFISDLEAKYAAAV